MVLLPRGTQEQKKIGCSVFAYGTIALFRVAFQQLPLTKQFITNPFANRIIPQFARDKSLAKLGTMRKAKDIPALQPSSLFSCKNKNKFRLLPFRSPLLGECFRHTTDFFSFPPLTKMFQFSGCASRLNVGTIPVFDIRFPHSETPGSQAATRLPEDYRSYATSFIAIKCQGIHHPPLRAFPLNKRV